MQISENYEQDKIKSRESGCDGHLTKPIDLQEVEKLLGETNTSNS